MTTDPRIAVRERALLLEGDEVRFHLDLHAATGPDLSVVVDVYDLENSVHPDGHFGWWKFSAAQLRPGTEGRLALSGGLAVTLTDAPATDAWVNPQQPAARHLAVNAVLRSNATNAIVDIDRIPAMATAADLAALRGQLDRDWARPRFATAPFVLDRDQTVHLVLPNLFLRDAVGNLCLDIYRMLKQNDFAVRLHATNADLALNDIVEPRKALSEAIGANDHILYFYSTHDPLLKQLTELAGQRSAYFHGITDPTKLRVFDPELSVVASRAQAALPLLASFDRLAANSAHSASHLRAAIEPATPDIAVIAPQLVAAAAPAQWHRPRDGSLLTVCQLSPHKKVEDVLRLFAAWRADHPAASCHVVGRTRSRAYRDYLAWVEVQELGLPTGAVQWHGSIDNETLGDLYTGCSVFVSMSEDEGFCLPVLESMRAGLPVFAYAIPAVIETLGGTGLTFTAKDYPHLAKALSVLLANPARLAKVAAAQSMRADELARHMTGQAFFKLLRPAAVS